MIIVIVVIGIAVFLYYFLKGKSNANSENTTQQAGITTSNTYQTTTAPPQYADIQDDVIVTQTNSAYQKDLTRPPYYVEEVTVWVSPSSHQQMSAAFEPSNYQSESQNTGTSDSQKNNSIATLQRSDIKS